MEKFNKKAEAPKRNGPVGYLYFGIDAKGIEEEFKLGEFLTKVVDEYISLDEVKRL